MVCVPHGQHCEIHNEEVGVNLHERGRRQRARKSHTKPGLDTCDLSSQKWVKQAATCYTGVTRSLSWTLVQPEGVKHGGNEA